jgi:hypothetical protein
MLTVNLRPPVIDGETVRYTFDPSAPLPLQTETSFWFRYEGVNLEWFAPEFLLEIFLALELKVLGRVDGPVRLVLPSPIPAPVADFWRGWNEAWNVEIEPIAATTTYDPWAMSPAVPLPQYRRAVFFGGGKDSTLVSQVWREADGAEQVLLIRGIYRTNAGDRPLQPARDRAESRLLEPNRRVHGLAGTCYWTSYPTTFTGEAREVRPHLELHTAGALPLLLAHGAETAAFCIERGSGFETKSPDGTAPQRPWLYRSSPEYLASQSRHYRETLGVDLTVTNPLWPFSFNGNLAVLQRRFPAAVATVVSCTGSTLERWCMRCEKCRREFQFHFGAGIVDPDYDYEAALMQPGIGRRLFAHIPADLPTGRNAPWTSSFPYQAGWYHAVCDAFGRLEPERYRQRLSPPAFARLLDLKRAYGNELHPHVVQVPRVALDQLPPAAREPFGRVAEAALEIVDDIPDFIDPEGATWFRPWHLQVDLPRGMLPG